MYVVGKYNISMIKILINIEYKQDIAIIIYHIFLGRKYFSYSNRDDFYVIMNIFNSIIFSKMKRCFTKESVLSLNP